jgi:diguanylate cyclase (GGDEF)-like protein
MKASRMADRADPHIVIGLSNISARVRREKEQALALQKATELASRDALTGVKSKRVFVEAEAEWDERIEAEPDIAFAIAMFDLNGLKYTNDTFGHAAGDDYIRRACKLICETFYHSPVYRVGGDEFSAILTGTDYAQRNALKARFRAANTGNVRDGDVVVACGMSDYIPGQDKRFQDVFERADAEMYENKKRLKFER